jgi:hypothetical protein
MGLGKALKRILQPQLQLSEMAQCRLPSWTLVVPVARLRVSVLVSLLVYEQFTGI